MKNLLFIFTLIFPCTYQLLCWNKCRYQKYKKGESFTDSYFGRCLRATKSVRCYGRLIVHYDLEEFELQSLTLSLGSEEHIIEKEMEHVVNTDRLEYLIYILYIFQADGMKKLVVNVFILCQTNNNCALDYVKTFFNFYQKQKDVFIDFDSLFVHTLLKQKVTCYDYKVKQTTACTPAEYPRCIAHNTKIRQHGCYSDPRQYIEYAFMIKPNASSVEKVHQLIVCNRNNCNNRSVIQAVESIIHNKTFGKLFILNKSNRMNLLEIFKFFFMIFYMIF